MIQYGLSVGHPSIKSDLAILKSAFSTRFKILHASSHRCSLM